MCKLFNTNKRRLTDMMSNRSQLTQLNAQHRQVFRRSGFFVLAFGPDSAAFRCGRYQQIPERDGEAT